MHPRTAYGYEPRLSLWLHVRRFAVPPMMIETATARRVAGDWAGACAAAGVDADLDLHALTRTRGRDLAARVRADLRRLAPDLLRWHLPRVAPDGLLRPGLTVALARYGPAGHDREGPGAAPVFLVARTPPAWAGSGQRISLALWDGSPPGPGGARHPHPRPGRRFRFDLHRHLWDADRAGELRARSGADRWPGDSDAVVADGSQDTPARVDRSSRAAPAAPADRSAEAAGTAEAEAGRTARPARPARPDTADRPVASVLDPLGLLPSGYRFALDRWADEAAIVLRADGGSGEIGGSGEKGEKGAVTVRFGARRRVILEPVPDRDGPVPVGEPVPRVVARSAAGPEAHPAGAAPPVLPDAATWLLPDLELLRAGLIGPGALHPLVAEALGPVLPDAVAAPSGAAAPAGQPRFVDCRGARHRIGLVDGVLTALDHDAAEIRREELLAALTGTPLPCLRVIDDAHRRPDCLPDVRARLDHGDTAGALAVVEGLLGSGALLRGGALRDALEEAARGRVAHGLYRADLAEPRPRSRPLPPSTPHRRTGEVRSRTRHATFR